MSGDGRISARILDSDAIGTGRAVYRAASNFSLATTVSNGSARGVDQIRKLKGKAGTFFGRLQHVIESWKLHRNVTLSVTPGVTPKVGCYV